MTGFLLTAGSISLLCASGAGLAAALKFFNTWEPDFSRKEKRSRGYGSSSVSSEESYGSSSSRGRSMERASSLRKNI